MAIASWWQWLRSGSGDERPELRTSARGSAAGSRRTLPRLEVLDDRIALSTIAVSATSAEHLTMSRLRAVTAAAQHTAEDVARTNNLELVSERLSELAAKIPDGAQQLAPVWQHDLASANLETAGARRALAQQLVADLDHDVVADVAAGQYQLVGAGAASFLQSSTTAQPSRDSVTIANNTGFTITVSATLNGSGRTIPPQTIANNASSLFDFGSTTNDSITIHVRRPGSNQPPPASVLLNRPTTGYFGKQFPVSVFSGFFTVRQ